MTPLHIVSELVMCRGRIVAERADDGITGPALLQHCYADPTTLFQEAS